MICGLALLSVDRERNCYPRFEAAGQRGLVKEKRLGIAGRRISIPFAARFPAIHPKFLLKLRGLEREVILTPGN